MKNNEIKSVVTHKLLTFAELQEIARSKKLANMSVTEHKELELPKDTIEIKKEIKYEEVVYKPAALLKEQEAESVKQEIVPVLELQESIKLYLDLMKIGEQAKFSKEITPQNLELLKAALTNAEPNIVSVEAVLESIAIGIAGSFIGENNMVDLSKVQKHAAYLAYFPVLEYTTHKTLTNELLDIIHNDLESDKTPNKLKEDGLRLLARVAQNKETLPAETIEIVGGLIGEQDLATLVYRQLSAHNPQLLISKEADKGLVNLCSLLNKEHKDTLITQFAAETLGLLAQKSTKESSVGREVIEAVSATVIEKSPLSPPLRINVMVMLTKFDAKDPEARKIAVECLNTMKEVPVFKAAATNCLNNVNKKVTPNAISILKETLPQLKEATKPFEYLNKELEPSLGDFEKTLLNIMAGGALRKEITGLENLELLLEKALTAKNVDEASRKNAKTIITESIKNGLEVSSRLKELVKQ